MKRNRNPWIPVVERYPKPFERVQVMFKEHPRAAIFHGKVDADYEWYIEGFSSSRGLTITYWRHIQNQGRQD